MIWDLEYLSFGVVAGPLCVRARADTMVLIDSLQEDPGTSSFPLRGPQGACQNLLGQNVLLAPSGTCNCSYSGQSRAAPVTHGEHLSRCADT